MIADLVNDAVERGGLPVDDVLALALPLLKQVRATHESGLVAPLRGITALRVEDHQIGFDPTAAAPAHRRTRAVELAQAPISETLEVRRGADRLRDLSGSQAAVDDEPPFASGPVPGGPDAGGPRFVPGWQRWEHLLAHHDELTDIGSLGELLAALCCGLDLSDARDVAALAEHHRDLFALVPSLHPVVAGVVSSMLEPDRHRRSQDLGDVIVRLATYRDQPEDFDLARVLATGVRARDRREAILTHLRDRLFDLSRRNPLLHFRPTQRTLNLTEASVPLLLDARNIRPEQLFTWNDKVAEKVLSGLPVSLGSVIRWDEAPYANGVLDTVLSQARRDRQEYGQAQLRLVVAFLRWHDLKGERDERISSPLLLLPVELTKKRGVRDSHVLRAVFLHGAHELAEAGLRVLQQPEAWPSFRRPGSGLTGFRWLC